MIDTALLDKAIGKWGYESQISMIQEEAIELALAIQKMNRVGGRNLNANSAIENVIDELADMKIMLAQADRIFDAEKINERVQFKMNRLEKRLNA